MQGLFKINFKNKKPSLETSPKFGSHSRFALENWNKFKIEEIKK